MAANSILRVGPVSLGTSAANILNPPNLSGGVGLTGVTSNTYIILRRIRIVNRTASAATFSLWVGASGGSAAGTEFMGSGTSVASNSAVDWYGILKLQTSDFLTGLAGTASALTFEAEGEIGIQ